MNNRTRIINTVLMREIDRQPFTFYFGPWKETLERWRGEGLGERDWKTGLNLDSGFRHVDVNFGYCPEFTHEVIEERERTLLIRDKLGILQEVRKHGQTIPKYIDYPVKDRSSWEKLKSERLDPDDKSRFPHNWDELVVEYNAGDHIMQLGCFPYGLFGTLRDMMGMEELSFMFYDDPELIRDMMDYLTDFWLVIYKKVCFNVKVHAIHIWEDMSGKTGSLISMDMVREYMLPNYKRIAQFAKEHDIPIISLDTDGDCTQLIPLFIEGGINLVFPFEVAAGSDVNQYRQQYPELCIMGGIDKREIAKGKDAIEKELDRIDNMFSSPGYIPALDHLFHPEISYKDFLYFTHALEARIHKYKN